MGKLWTMHDRIWHTVYGIFVRITYYSILWRCFPVHTVALYCNSVWYKNLSTRYVCVCVLSTKQTMVCFQHLSRWWRCVNTFSRLQKWASWISLSDAKCCLCSSQFIIQPPFCISYARTYAYNNRFQLHIGLAYKYNFYHTLFGPIPSFYILFSFKGTICRFFPLPLVVHQHQ